MAEYLARLTIDPIKKHNESLANYSHNVAHELKTPLSVMKSDMEIMELKHPSISLHSLSEEVDNMQHIVDGLLMLAHPEKDASEEKIEVESLIENIIKKYGETGEIAFSKDAYKKQFVPKILFERLCTNLIENAKRHGTGNIKIHLVHNQLSIENTVEKNITQKEIEKLTEIFYQ
jgi:signal transduction histidine kinase